MSNFSVEKAKSLRLNSDKKWLKKSEQICFNHDFFIFNCQKQAPLNPTVEKLNASET